MHITTIRLLKEIINGMTNVGALKEVLGKKEWQFNALVKKMILEGYLQKTENDLRLQNNAKTKLFASISKSWDIEKLLRDSNELVQLRKNLTIKR